jgi:poly-gamma-glutamate capsule biosynthesis protein CapA/YwtB (metallophosphatase superfamily)
METSPPTAQVAAVATGTPARLAPAEAAPAMVEAGAPRPGPEPEIVIAAVGDIMLGSTYPAGSPLPPRDGAKLLAEVTPVLRAADLAFGNLEGPLVDGDDPPTCTAGAIAEKRRGRPGGDGSCWAFRVPARYGKLLADAGFGVLSLANNHIEDFGERGLTSTREVLDRLGVAYSGPAGTVAHRDVRGIKVDVIAFAPYAGLNDLDDLDAARALVAASARAADVVVVSFHGGAEGIEHQHVPLGRETFYGENRGQVRDFARAMVDAGAHLVVGHGPHVVRGMEVWRGHLIAYSLGSFATYGGINVSGRLGVSLILEARLAKGGALRGGRVHAVRQIPPGGPTLDPTRQVIPILRELSVADFGEAAVRLDDGGELAAP